MSAAKTLTGKIATLLLAASVSACGTGQEKDKQAETADPQNSAGVPEKASASSEIDAAAEEAMKAAETKMDGEVKNTISDNAVKK